MTRARGVRAGRPLRGSFTPPGDKSITHRALLFGAIAEGTTCVRSPNPGEDCARSARAAEALGARVSSEAEAIRVTGVEVLRAPDASLECGNSGTSMRLLAGLVSGHPLDVVLTGDASLSSRPMRRIVEPLTRMGARLRGRDADARPPLHVRGGDLAGIDYDIPMASAQVATAVLLAGLRARGSTRVRLPGPARDHTERMLPAFGAPLTVRALPGGGREVELPRAARLVARDVIVPGDFSAASFLLAAAAAQPGASVTAVGVNVNETRSGLLDVLLAMGAEVERASERVEAGEPVADVTVRGPARLRAFDVPREWVPRMIDEVPAWVVLATAAEGRSRLEGAAELRVKESDRLRVLAAGLAACGADVSELADGLIVTGGPLRGGATIATHGDHRIAMAFAALATRLPDPLWFDDVSAVATSDPRFFETLEALGASIEPGKDG